MLAGDTLKIFFIITGCARSYKSHSLHNQPNLFSIIPYFLLHIITTEVDALCATMFKDQKSVLIQSRQLFIKLPCLEGNIRTEMASTQFLFQVWEVKAVTSSKVDQAKL